MTRRVVLALAFLLAGSARVAVRAQQDPLQGRWEGMVRSLQGGRKGQTFRLRRVITVVSQNTVTLVDEFSQDGGAFQRLGNGTFTKIGVKP